MNTTTERSAITRLEVERAERIAALAVTASMTVTAHRLVARELVTIAELIELRPIFDIHGPFHTAKAAGVLVDNSGEEFAVRFMTAFNAIRPNTY